MPSASKRIIKKTLKVIGWAVASVVLLLVMIALLIQVPFVQTWITKKAVASIEETIGTDVSLGGVAIGFPKSVILREIYFADQKGDTLLFAGRISVNTDLWGLVRREIRLININLENTVARIDRAENDSAFNFTYILDAFAGDSTAVPDTLEQKSWNITLETLELEDIDVRFDDYLQGNFLDLALGHFKLNMHTFDLENNAYAVEDIILENTRAGVHQTKMPQPSEGTEQAEDSAAALIFSLDRVQLQNVNLRYAHALLGQDLSVDLGKLQVDAQKIDLPNREIALNNLTLAESEFVLHVSKKNTRPSTETKPAESQSEPPWTIALDKLELTNNTIEHSDFTQPKKKQGLDFSHLLLTGFEVSAQDIGYDGENIKANIENVSFRDQSGFAFRSFKSEIMISEREAAIKEFLLVTDNSRLELQAQAEYTSFANIGDTWKKAKITSNINNSHLNVRDILYLNPTLLDSLPLSLPPTTNLHFDAAINGTVNNLVIQHLRFASLSDTYLDMSGRISGLPQTEKLDMNIIVDRLRTTRVDLEAILPDTLLPDSIQPPAWMELQARYKGNLSKADFNTVLTSNVGSIEARGNMDLDSASAGRGINVWLDVNDFDVGAILSKPDSVMGQLAMNAHFKSKGLSPDEMDGRLRATVDHFDFRGYRYNNLQVEGTIRDQAAMVVAYMADENLDFAIDAKYVFRDDVPRYDFTFDLKNADFRALNLSTSPIRARGTLMVDLATSDFKVINGNVGIRKVAVFNGDDLYAVDSLLFASIDQQGKSEIRIDSDLLQATFEGSINIFGLPSVLREYFHSYYSLHDSLEVKDSPPQRFSFDIQLRNTDLITDLLVPNLTTFDPGPIKGEFDSEDRNLDISIEIDALQYGNIGIQSFNFKTESDENALRYNLGINKVMIDSMKVDGLEFKGAVANNTIVTDLIILDSADSEKYVLSGTLLRTDQGVEVTLPPEGIVLNYQPWSVPENNVMRFGGDKFFAQNVELVNFREKIIIQSDEKPGTPVSIGFRELNLEYLTSMIAEERPASGLLHGDIHLLNAETGFTFTSDLSVTDFRIRDIPWGNIDLHVAQQMKNQFDVRVALAGNQNDVRINGTYRGGDAASMNIGANVNRFDLGSLQPLLINQFRDLKGMVQGQITVKGTPQRPDIDGGLVVRKTSFFSNFLNTNFSIDEETISFVEEGISFNRFEVADQSGNKAQLDGAILTRNYRDFEFRLDLATNNFRLLNTTEGDNDLFYGRIDVDANARIRGNTTTPIVDVDIGLAEGSNLTYIVPQSEASVLAAEGIVRFVDRSFEDDPFMKRIEGEASDTVKSIFRGIDLTARIELTDQERFTIVIDPLTQDQLSISGNSTLTLQMDPTGDMNLTGRFEIAEGTYNLSFYKFVKREFQIEKGSSITWLGDPLNAQMDIRAIYNIETAPIELFTNQLSGVDPNEVNRYKQRLPFMVYLNLTGELLQPEIAFKLEMPIDERDAFGGNVYARLQDINTRESDLNKQVFALLILKRFISDDPFENQAGGGFESTARRSVSKILSEQLNRLSENIKGVELSFDIKSYEDYTSGQAQGQTELELGVSKSMFNNRLVVKLSGNIDIEGENANRDATDFIGDLALEYKVTPDGRFRITGFRNSNYDMIDGELIETGAGLIYVKDYNALSELFKSNAEKKN